MKEQSTPQNKITLKIISFTENPLTMILTTAVAATGSAFEHPFTTSGISINIPGDAVLTTQPMEGQSWSGLQHYDSQAKVIYLTRTFKLVFLTVLLLSVLSFFVALFLSFQVHPSPQQNDLFNTCSTSWKIGFGAIVGLMGGKGIDSL